MTDVVVLCLSLTAALITLIASVVSIIKSDTGAALSGTIFGFVFASIISCLSFSASRRSREQQRELSSVVNVVRSIIMAEGAATSASAKARRTLHEQDVSDKVKTFQSDRHLVEAAIAESECRQFPYTLAYLSAISNICRWGVVYGSQEKFHHALDKLLAEMKQVRRDSCDDRNITDAEDLVQEFKQPCTDARRV